MKIKIISCFIIALLLSTTLQSQAVYNMGEMQKEKLGRGVVALRENPSEVVVSWRYLSSDPESTAFNIYRDGKIIAEVPANAGTFYKDSYQGTMATTYTVKPVVDGKESALLTGSYTLPANAPQGYINIPLIQFGRASCRERVYVLV